MKKFSLQRAMSFGIAVAATVTLSGCNHNLNNEVSAEPTNSIAQVTDTPNNEFGIDVEVNFESREFAFDPSLPIMVPIEEVVMPDGEIGYKMPRGYRPYLVDRTKPFPGMVEVLESGEDYVINSGAQVTYTDGSKGYLGFDGAVAIYYPYYNYLMLLQEQKSAFYTQYYEAKATYGDDSPICDMYRTVIGLEDAAKEMYYGDSGRVFR